MINVTNANNETWIQGNTGVIGVSPTSSYWDYLFANFKFANDEIFLAYNLNNDDNQSYNSLFAFNKDHLFQGSHFSMSSLASNIYSGSTVNVTLNPSQTHWTLPNVSLKLGNSTTPFLNGTACLAFKDPNVFSAHNFGVFQEMVNQKLCGSASCPVRTSLENAPSITVEWIDGQGFTHSYVVPP